MEQAAPNLISTKEGNSPIKKKLKSTLHQSEEKHETQKRVPTVEFRNKKQKKIIEALQKSHLDPTLQHPRLGIYLVSVGKASFEGERLLATVRMFNTHFDFVLVVVADSLQRFNLAALQTPNGSLDGDENRRKAAIQQKAQAQLNLALRAGEEWKARAQKIFEETMPKRHAFLTWEQLKGNQRFRIEDKTLLSDKPYLADLNTVSWSEAFHSGETTVSAWEKGNSPDSKKFHAALADSVLEYHQRKQKDSEEEFNKIAEYFDGFSQAYLKEECRMLAAMTHSLAPHGFHIILYPNDGASPILEFTLQQCSEKYGDKNASALPLLTWIPFHFKNRLHSTSPPFLSLEMSESCKNVSSKQLFPLTKPLSSFSSSAQKNMPFPEDKSSPATEPQFPFILFPLSSPRQTKMSTSTSVNPGKTPQGFFHISISATLPCTVSPEEAAKKTWETFLGQVTQCLHILKPDEKECQSYLFSFIAALSSSVQHDAKKYAPPPSSSIKLN